MALDFFPPAVLALLVDSKEFNAKMDAAMGKLEEVSGVADKSGSGFTKFGQKAATAVIATGAAVAAFSVDEAFKYQESLDKLRDTTNISASMLAHVGKVALQVSDDTGQSAEDIVAAYGAVEAAGYKRAAADAAVAAAAKLTLIVGGQVADNTQTLIAAQNLGITKGMSAAKVADLLTIATKGNEAGLQGVVNLLSGKVGSAFAAYHQSAGEAVAVANEFSLAHITQTRQIATFVQKLGALQGPIQTTTVMNGKLETSSASYVNSLVDVGLNVNKTRDAFSGPNGLINGLKYLKTTADGSLPQLQRYLTAIFGATGVGAGMALIDNINKVSASITAANKASAGGLNVSASIASGQLDNQIKIIEQRLRNAAIRFGLTLMPYVQDAAKFLIKALDHLDSHPGERAAIEISLGAAFAASVGLKIAQATQSSLQTSLLGKIALNTAATATATETTAGEGGVGDAEGAGGLAGVATTFGKSVLVFGAGVLAFEAASKFLSTKEGKKIGNSIIENNFMGLGTISNVAADLLNKRLKTTPDTSKTELAFLKKIGALKDYEKMQMDQNLNNNYPEVQRLAQAIAKLEAAYEANQNRVHGSAKYGALGAPATLKPVRHTTVKVKVTK